MGGIVQPLFSAFGEDSLWTRLEDAGTAAIVTQMKHVRKVRRIRERLPELRAILVVDGKDAALKELETPLDLDACPCPRISRSTPRRPRRRRSCTTPPAPRASPRAPSMCTTP
jgi:hypothetical protein